MYCVSWLGTVLQLGRHEWICVRNAVVYMFWVQRHVLLLGEVCRLCVMSTVVMDFVYMQGFALLSTAYTTVAV